MIIPDGVALYPAARCDLTRRRAATAAGTPPRGMGRHGGAE
jgi:hypothetical protein